MPEKLPARHFFASWLLLGSDSVAKSLAGDWKVAGRKKPKPYTFLGR